MSITLTESAIKEVKNVMESQSLTNEYLRLGVTGGGCSGFSYSLSFVANKDYDPKIDKKYEFDGVEVIVDRKSELYLEDTTLDFMEDIDKRGFVFMNPSAVRECGCGKSFAV